MNKIMNALALTCCFLGAVASLLSHNWPATIWACAALGWCYAYIDAMEKK